jgi:hypothetical protein
MPRQTRAEAHERRRIRAANVPSPAVAQPICPDRTSATPPGRTAGPERERGRHPTVRPCGREGIYLKP